ncbi:hypothetical protein [Arthrobacter sp. JZ12]|uniref:hypothetical protein n=1 Tax=Arthrobacter sp. JZ12 TaxID=2654190 RepID=UPI002B463E3A|nr:hypothetical protein [Arthrobacter sp. JZ12]
MLFTLLGAVPARLHTGLQKWPQDGRMMASLPLQHARCGQADVRAVLIGADAVPQVLDTFLTEAGIGAAATGSHAVEARLDRSCQVSGLQVP